MRTIPTILCGRAGSGFEPVSRELNPNLFIRLAAGQINPIMIEVQSGEYLGKSNMVHFEDVYGRCQ